jgi:hypothetical protein
MNRFDKNKIKLLLDLNVFKSININIYMCLTRNIYYYNTRKIKNVNQLNFLFKKQQK